MNIGKLENTFKDFFESGQGSRQQALKIALEEAVNDELELDRQKAEAKEVEELKAKALLLEEAKLFLQDAFWEPALLEAFSPQLEVSKDSTMGTFSVIMRFQVMGESLVGHYRDNQVSLRGCVCESPEEFYRELMVEALTVARAKRSQLPNNAKRYGQ